MTTKANNTRICGCGDCEDAAKAAFKILQTSVHDDNDCPLFILAVGDALTRYARELMSYEILDATVRKVGKWGEEAGNAANESMDYWIDAIHGKVVREYLQPKGCELDHMRSVYNLARGGGVPGAPKSYTIEQYHEELHVQIAERAVPGGDDLTPGDPLASLLAAILNSTKPN
jgi:hypothetical protein